LFTPIGARETGTVLTRSETEGSVSPSQPLNPVEEKTAKGFAVEAVASGKARFVFRGDDNYRGGPLGLPLGAEADTADIQDFAEHVLRKESQRTSRYTSFTTEMKIARKFTSAPDNRYVNKAAMVVLRQFEEQGVLKIWDAEQVFTTLSQSHKKLARQAADVRAVMRKNREILLEGRIPDGVLQPAN
jgi:hypothetical protein